jgi:HJR/Mrr/RecB family endonuclease
MNKSSSRAGAFGRIDTRPRFSSPNVRDKKRVHKAVALSLLYGLFAVWFCDWSRGEILHSLVAGALIALPYILWRFCVKRSYPHSQSAPTYRGNEAQMLIDRNQPTMSKYGHNICMSAKSHCLDDERDDERLDALAEQILRRNQVLIDKFLEIAERKISVPDAYGDENWDALPREILFCVKKLAQREGRTIDWNDYSRAKRRIKRDHGCVVVSRQAGHAQLDAVLPKGYQLIEAKLQALFLRYHERRRAEEHKEVDIDALSGIEFQTHVATVLRSCGYDVMGTPITGDQGGDLVAKKSGKTYVIQSKRSKNPVGNRAVQEAISAVKYYRADEGWVVTNSTFTRSAGALAKQAKIKLIDGLTLRTKSFL